MTRPKPYKMQYYIYECELLKVPYIEPIQFKVPINTIQSLLRNAKLLQSDAVKPMQVKSQTLNKFFVSHKIEDEPLQLMAGNG